MIFGQLPGRSPEGKVRSIIKSINQTPLYHMTCLQVSKTCLHYDDVHYQNACLSKIVVMGRVVSMQKGVSPRGVQMLTIRVEDSTGRCVVSFYSSEEIETICREAKGYVKMGINIKCAGLVYRPEIKLIGVSIAEITDFNELTAHALQCIRTSIKTQ